MSFFFDSELEDVRHRREVSCAMPSQWPTMHFITVRFIVGCVLRRVAMPWIRRKTGRPYFVIRLDRQSAGCNVSVDKYFIKQAIYKYIIHKIYANVNCI